VKAIIIGAGGFGKEIAFLLQSLSEYELLGFVDDEERMQGKEVVGNPVLGNVDSLMDINKKTAVFIGIASPDIKEKVYQKLKENTNLVFPNLIAPSALIGINVHLGIGNILMPYTTYTADIVLGNFNMVNISSTVGHDVKIGSYNSIFPSVNLSGHVTLGDKNEIGVGTKIIPNTAIGNRTIIGAGSVVVKDIESCTKNVGVPARIIERWD
jgi:sugar O-acyltransferase (sialic acid O-acetyltransferase NeuD family)